MQTELQVSLDSESHLHPENISFQDGDPVLTISATDDVLPKKPAKRPTRQWAAWTRQEEESFFTALRQVGKNFEKITRRVQSKNKDQVRHYYYRLVRRMNKLLGPGLCLDAKNSKDTNAAMLRWWSLLEKYSCKASKLHLKPRRFKIFIEALEHQLLKDRRKNVRKRPSQGENCLPPTPSTVSNQNRASGQDARTVKLVLVDSQNIQKLGSGKTLKRNTNVGVNRSNNRGESTAMKPPRQRRKPAAYKKWEKAAIAGVSLVADAAEHLERSATDKEVDHEPGIAGQKDSDPIGKVLSPLATFSHNLFVENNMLTSMKLKLQLFPIDDITRRALEMDKHNPFLELTLSTRKKISSVLEHLNRKWGNSSVASGELMLFPYSFQGENLVGCQSWTQDSVVSAADVYGMLGRPPVFRLKYGWFSNTELSSAALPAPSASCCILSEHNMNEDNIKEKITGSAPPISMPSTNAQSVDLYEDQQTSRNKNHTLPHASTDVPSEMNKFTCKGPKHNLVESDRATNISWHGKEAAGDGTIVRQLEYADDLRLSAGTAQSAGEWADTLTNISIGDLLSGVSHYIDANCIDQPIAESSQCLQQMPFSCDSFDAAIAAHISKHQDKMGYQPTLSSHACSIWDAEETCDAFAFKKNPVLCQEDPSLSRVASPGACKQTARTSLEGTGCSVEELPEVEKPVEDPAQGDPEDESESDPHILDDSAKDFSTLADIYWPDSLGPLDLDVPSSKYHNEDLILSDSLSGLNRLIASSLDAFQNCSFFGFEKKESAAAEAREAASSFSNFKIGSGV